MSKIYYAHPMSWYDTDDEVLDIEALKSDGQVVNPNTPYFSSRVLIAQQENRPVMQLFADFIASDKCDVVAFRRFNDGRIGAGVAREIFEALIWGKEVWEIRTHGRGPNRIIDKALLFADDGLSTADVNLEDVLTVAETRRRCKAGEM